MEAQFLCSPSDLLKFKGTRSQKVLGVLTQDVTREGEVSVVTRLPQGCLCWFVFTVDAEEKPSLSGSR